MTRNDWHSGQLGRFEKEEPSNNRTAVFTYRKLWPDHERLVAWEEYKGIRGARTVHKRFSLAYRYIKFNNLNARPTLLYLTLNIPRGGPQRTPLGILLANFC